MIGVTILAALGAALPAWATVDNLKGYKAAYPGKNAKAYSCTVCHLGVMGTRDNLNSYGMLLKQLPAPANTKKLTEADYRAAEAQDPDADGATTLQELEAGTDPADPASVPAETAPPAPGRAALAAPPAGPAAGGPATPAGGPPEDHHHDHGASTGTAPGGTAADPTGKRGTP